MAGTWIIFHAEPDQPGWEGRRLPEGGLTGILNESWDFSKRGQIPQVGERFRQFLQIEEFVEPGHPKTPTHTREGDWVVTRVEHYPAGDANNTRKEIVVCYCRFDPIESEPQPIGRAKSDDQVRELQELLLA